MFFMAFFERQFFIIRRHLKKICFYHAVSGNASRSKNRLSFIKGRASFCVLGGRGFSPNASQFLQMFRRKNL